MRLLGHINQGWFAAKELGRRGGECLVVGSKDYGSSIPFGEIIGANVTGIDLEAGKGVDRVLNLEDGPEDLEGRFDTVICCSVLEHTPVPWKLASGIERCIKPGGVLYVSVPWVHRYHPYPDDYYRFSWSAIKSLSRRVEFHKFEYSTGQGGEFFPAERGMDQSFTIKDGKRKYLACLELHCLGIRKPWPDSI